MMCKGKKGQFLLRLQLKGLLWSLIVCLFIFKFVSQNECKRTLTLKLCTQTVQEVFNGKFRLSSELLSNCEIQPI